MTENKWFNMLAGNSEQAPKSEKPEDTIPEYLRRPEEANPDYDPNVDYQQFKKQMGRIHNQLQSVMPEAVYGTAAQEVMRTTPNETYSNPFDWSLEKAIEQTSARAEQQEVQKKAIDKANEYLPEEASFGERLKRWTEGFSSPTIGVAGTSITPPKETHSYREALAGTTWDIVSSLPTDEGGKVLVNGLAYDKNKLSVSLMPYVEAAIEPVLMRDKGYWDVFAQKRGFDSYTSMLDFYDAKVDELASAIKPLDLTSSVSAINPNPNVQSGAMFAQAMSREASGAKAVRDARDKLNAMRDGTFWNGVFEGGDAFNALTLGLSGLYSEIELNKTLNKVYDGEALTEREQAIFDIYSTTKELESLDNYLGKSWIRDVGNAIGVTAEMAPQFIPAMGVAGSLANLSKVGIKTGYGLVRRAMRQGITNGVIEIGKQTARVGYNVGKNLFMANVGGAVGAIMQPATYSNFIQKRNEQFSMQNGRLVYTPTEEWKDFVNALIEQTNEVSSEVLGGAVSDILGLSFKGFGKMLGIDKAVNSVSSSMGLGASYGKLFGIKKSDAFKAFERSLSYAGDPFSEALSEIWGDVSSNFMKMLVSGDADWSQFNDPRYWTTNLAVAAIYGGAMQMAHEASRIPDYMTIANLGKVKHETVRTIESKMLADALRMMGVDKDINASAQRLASIDWGSQNPMDRAKAADYIRAEAIQQVMLGVSEENTHLTQFARDAQEISASVYTGKDGNAVSDKVIEAELEDGTMVNVVSGDMTDMDAIIMVRNSEGVVEPIARQKIKIVAMYDVASKVEQRFKDLFGQQQISQKIAEIEQKYDELVAPTKEDVAQMMEELSIAEPQEGETITLVDGRKALFLGWNEDMTLNVEAQSADGTYELLVVPFHKILSSASHIAEAQIASLADKTLDVAKEELVNEEAEATTAETIKEGVIVDTPQGKARVVQVGDDSIIVDHNLNSNGRAEDMETAEYALNEVGLPTSLETEPVAVEQQDSEQAQAEAAKNVEVAQNAVAGIKAVPMNEDGTINYDAIDDPIVFAQQYKNEVGNVEQTIADVTETRNAAEVKAQEVADKSKKLTSMNERNASRKEVEALKQRVAFYDAVLKELTPKEEKTVGLVENEFTRDINEDVLATIEEFAQRFGVLVELVEAATDGNGNVVNGYIKDGKVYLTADGKLRTRSLSFLVGHEFTHRMKDLSPEQFETYKQSVRAFVGEDKWAKLILNMQSRYVFNNMPKQAEDTALMEEEVASDFMGTMVESNDVFNSYLYSLNAETGLLAAIKRVLRAIGELFTGKEEKRVDEMLNQVNALIAAAEKTNAEGETLNDGKAKMSIIGEQDGMKYSVSSAPIFYSNAQYAVQNIKQEKATPEQWLKMIEKNGGLKAGEDKWLGLSDWLKASDKKALTKDEVLQYIAENDIQIEEVEYSETNTELLDRVGELTNDLYYIDESINSLSESIAKGKQRLKTLTDAKRVFDEKAEALKQEYGEDSPEYQNHIFYNSYTDDIESLEASIVQDEEYYNRQSERADALRSELEMLNEEVGDEREINSTRLDYTTKGLGNKREIALAIPTIEPWNTNDNIHFGDAGEGRAIAWIRFGEATDAEGKRVLVIDEIQSKRHQEGREKGYRPSTEQYLEENGIEVVETGEFYEFYKNGELDKCFSKGLLHYDINRAKEMYVGGYVKSDVPSAPFEKNWAELAFKRMLRYAAENGYDYVAWTTGEQQNERYGLSKVVDNIHTDFRGGDNGSIRIEFKGGGDHHIGVDRSTGNVTFYNENPTAIGKPLADVIGKELADKILTTKTPMATFGGVDLDVTGKGMTSFYDQMLPSFVKKYTKKWGAEVGEVTMPALEENNTMHAVNVTDSMRESVMQGQPKFSLAVVQGVYDALKEYEATSDIETFVNKVRDVNDNIALGHPFLTNAILDYDEFGAEEFERKVRMIVGDYDDGGYAPYTAGGVRYSLSSSNKSAIRYDKENGTNVKEFFDFLRNGKVFEDGKPNLFHIANAGELLQHYGIKGKFMVGKFTFSRTHTDNEDHNLGLKEWVDVINNINNPLAIASYKGQPNQFRIYTYATINGKNICVGVNVSLKDNSIELSNIISAYGRDINSLLGKEGVNLLYPNSIEELKQRISQVSTAHNSLLNATSSASENKDTTSNAEIQTNEQKFSLITPEMDASYLDAVERGDMETAQKMVMEAAEKAGYINDESWRMNHRAPRKDEENANPFNTEKIVPEDFWEHPEWYTNIRHSSETRESYYAMKPAIDKYKRLMAEGKTDEAENVTITMYRGVDKTANKREASFRNGDWITPSRSYALLSAPYGKARVISQEVKLKDIWWDGNSIDEWGYDDGANYGYRDTKNNRKLLDPVTYDDNGNVIPLSERFNPKKGDIRYSLIGEIGAANIEEYGRYGSPMLALEMARELEAQGKSVKDIRLATNWERGVDGKWRYEIMDGKYNHPDMSDFQYLKKVHLSDVLDNPDLYKAYPYLKDMYVVYTIFLPNGVSGSFNGSRIELDAKDTVENNLSTLIHELQHAIQSKEMFADGGNVKERAETILKDITNELDSLREDLAKTSNLRILRKAYLAYYLFKRQLYADRVKTNLSGYAYQAYKRLAGEVEARNVQKRMSMTPEERLRTLLSATEDVARKDQSIIYAEAMSSEERAELNEPLFSVRDMPFFEDNGDVIIFDDLAEEDARERKPLVTEDTLRSYIDGRHYAATQRIRKEADDMKQIARLRLQEEHRKRSDGIISQRSNVGKVSYILGDIPRGSLSFYDQALVMIAEGEVSIMWGTDKNGSKGLAAELGLKDGEKKDYRQITKGATQSFEGFVHNWWESLGGYEMGIDTQDLRNALIEALSETGKAHVAINILRQKYDAPQQEYDNAIADIEAHVDRELQMEDARYKEEIAEFEGGANKQQLTRYYEQNAIFNDDISAIRYTIRELEKKLERATREVASARQRNKEYTKKVVTELRENIEAAKATIKEAISNSPALKFYGREVQSVVASLGDVRSSKSLEAVLGRVENMLLNIRIREERNNMQRLLNMRLPNGQLVEEWVGNQIREGRMTAAEGHIIISDMFRGVNSKGVKVAKKVDNHVQEVMTFLRNELVLPIAKKRVRITLESGTERREFDPEKELTEPTKALRAANDMAIKAIEEKAAEGGRDYSTSEKVELEARDLFNLYLDVVEYKYALHENKERIETYKERIRNLKAGVEDLKAQNKPVDDIIVANIEAARNILSKIYANNVEHKRNYEKNIQTFNKVVGDLLAKGRDALKAFRIGKEEHKAKIITLALKAIGGKDAKSNPQAPTSMEKVAAFMREWINDPYWTFETCCREIDRFAPNGEGEFFKYFMGGAQDAANKLILSHVAHMERVGDKIQKLWRKHRNKTPYKAYEAVMTEADTHVVGPITYMTKWDAENQVAHNPETTELRISNAMYIIAMWRQAQYQETMARYGITQEKIDAIIESIRRIDPRYIDFMDFVNDTFLPATRLEYDEVHKKMFGTSMAEIKNYFPAEVIRKYEEVDVSKTADGALPSTVTRSIISRRPHGNLPKFTLNYFGMLLSHIQDMDHWASYGQLIEDINTVLSNVEFKKRLNEYMSGTNNDRTGAGSLYHIFRTRCAIMTGAYQSKRMKQDWVKLLTRGFASSNISWRLSTALKQLSASPLFAAYSVNPKCLAIWAKNFVIGAATIRKTIAWAVENSPSFRERWAMKYSGNEKLMQTSRDIRTGIDPTIASRSAIVKAGKNTLDIVEKIAVEWGMAPNAAIDAWVCATGMKTIYEFEISKATGGKREATEQEKNATMRKVEIFMNTTQQSAESAYISEIQAQGSWLTMYMNASYAFHRLRIRGAQELWKGLTNKGYRRNVIDKYGKEALSDANKKATARLIQGIIGDLNFWMISAAGKSLWGLINEVIYGADDDEDEDEPMTAMEKIWSVARVPLSMAFNGYVGGNLLGSAIMGFEVDYNAPMNSLFEDIKKVFDFKEDDEDNVTDLTYNIWGGCSLVAKYGLGVDLNTYLNIVRGFGEINSVEGIMKIFNEPRSAIKLIAGRRRKGETMKEYVDRLIHLELVIDNVTYEDLVDEEDNYIGEGKISRMHYLSAKQVRGFMKEYRERQLRKVLSREEFANVNNIDERYDIVCERMGWDPEKTPTNDKVDKSGDYTLEQNRKNLWIFPEGLTEKEYYKLKEIAAEVAAKCRERNKFIGSDESLKSLLEEEYNLKQNVIDVYNEL